MCNSVKCARGAHFGRLSRIGPKGAGSYANSGINRQRRFVRLKVRQRKIGSADCWRTLVWRWNVQARQENSLGHRQTRTGAVEEFGSEDIGSLHVNANSAAQELAACTQMQIRQRTTACASQGPDLARSETWTKNCPRHVNDSIDDAARAGRWGCQVGMQNVGSGSYGYPRSWNHGGWPGVALNLLKIMGDHGGKTSHYLVDNGAIMFMGEHGWDSVPLLP